jgi:hypothetical protein
MVTIPSTKEITGLKEALAGAPELSDENKERVCMIEDIAKLRKLLGAKPLTADQFYGFYDMPIKMLETIQHFIQVEWNTVQYFNSNNKK